MILSCLIYYRGIISIYLKLHLGILAIKSNILTNSILNEKNTLIWDYH